MALPLFNPAPLVSSLSLLASSWKSRRYFCLTIGRSTLYYTIHSNTSSHSVKISHNAQCHLRLAPR